MKFRSRGIPLVLCLLGFMLLSAPAIAEPVAVYGSTSGTNLSLHPEYGAAITIPGQSGALFDQSVANFTAPGTSLIFIGNDSSFSADTASAIEQAVWDGRILVISYPATEKFSDSLPLVTVRVDSGGNYLEQAGTSDPVSQKIFSGAAVRFNITGPGLVHLVGSPKPGTTILLKYGTGEPALAYRKYGNGYVIEWAMAAPDSILGVDNADRINAGVIASLAPVSPVSSAQTPLPAPANATGTTVPPQSPEHLTGNITVQSNPLGAMVFIDGIYQGVTPLELGGFNPGYHAVKMSMDGRYDFDGSVFVVNGERITVFGSLPRQENTGMPVNTAQTVSPVQTSPPVSEPLTNPAVVAATIGVVTASIGAFATIYSQRMKGKKD